VLALLNMEIASLFAYGTPPLAGQNRLTGGDACYNVYTTKDGEQLTVACNEPKFFRAFCAALQLPELADRQFGDAAEQRRLKARIQAAIAERTLAEWTAALAADQVAVAPVRRLDQVLADEHYRARNMFIAVPAGSQTVQVAPVIPASAGAPVPTRPAPVRGQDTIAILARLGLPPADVGTLLDTGVVAGPSTAPGQEPGTSSGADAGRSG
jgi:alpha-methylacyl-CoA racemase